MSTPAPLPPPLDSTLMGYRVSDVALHPWRDYLKPWTPPLPADGEVVLVSLFADVFMREPAGSVIWLNPIARRIDRMAASTEEFWKLVKEHHIAFLKTPLVDALHVNKMGLERGRLYGLRTPLDEGGRWEIGNVGTATFAESFAYLASRFGAPGAIGNQPSQTAARASEPPPLELPPLELPKSAKPAEKPKKKGWF